MISSRAKGVDKPLTFYHNMLVVSSIFEDTKHIKQNIYKKCGIEMPNAKSKRTGIINDLYTSTKTMFTALFRDNTDELAKEAAKRHNKNNSKK